MVRQSTGEMYLLEEEKYERVNPRLHVGTWHCFVLEKIEMKNNFYENDIFTEIYFIYMMWPHTQHKCQGIIDMI